MAITDKLITEVSAAIQNGLPICSKPYDAIASKLACSVSEILKIITLLKQQGTIKRFGVVVKHRKLGYTANAMVVWDIKSDEVEHIGNLFAKEDAVTLCYQRPRQLPHWPYNLFTMLHGKQRAEVLNKLKIMIKSHNIHAKYEVLFSTKCFKQRGANYQQENYQTNKEVQS